MFHWMRAVEDTGGELIRLSNQYEAKLDAKRTYQGRIRVVRETSVRFGRGSFLQRGRGRKRVVRHDSEILQDPKSCCLNLPTR
jgi:hypothetical protein